MNAPAPPMTMPTAASRSPSRVTAPMIVAAGRSQRDPDRQLACLPTYPISHDPIDADGGQDQRHEGQREPDPRHETRQGEAVRPDLVQRGQVEHRELRVDGANRRANRRADGRAEGVRVAADSQACRETRQWAEAGPLVRQLPVGEIDLRPDLGVRPPADVTDDADDPDRTRTEQRHFGIERRPVAEKLTRERLVDHGDIGLPVQIAVGELPALPQGNPQVPEIVG